MPRVKESRFFEALLKRYYRAPSIVLCRIPELEYLSRVNLEHPVLDHCCGDGFLSGIAFPGVILDAGVDRDLKSLARARACGCYRRLDQADAGRALPYEKGVFLTVINNSGLEHIPDLDKALSEISRVLKPGGKLLFTVLNKRYFDRWPLSAETARQYKRWQPFHHALDERQWIEILERHHFGDISFQEYFPPASSEALAKLDYTYSSLFFRHWLWPGLALKRLYPAFIAKRRWRALLGDFQWQALPGQGSGFFVSAVKRG